MKKPHGYFIGRRGDSRLTRRGFLETSGRLAAALAAGVAPAWVRQAGASTPRKISFTLPWLFVGGQAHEYVSQKRYWRERGLEVEISRGRGSGAAVKDIGTGAFMFGEASLNVMVNGIGQGLDLVGIGVKCPTSPMGISCRKEANVRTPKDLEGKSLGNAPGSGDTHLLPGFAASAGFDLSKVHRVSAAPDKLIPTLMAKQVDCVGVYYVSNGAAIHFQDPSVNTLLYHDYGVVTLDLGLITTPKMVKEEPKLCQDMADGFYLGLKEMLLEPEASLDIMIEAKPELKTQPRKLLLTQLGNTNALAWSQAFEKSGLGWMDAEEQRQTRENVMRYMDIANVPPTEKLFTNQFAGKVKLTAEEWRKARAWAAPYLPKKA
jgi:NitT/TauT family transport system substrate-binding protein